MEAENDTNEAVEYTNPAGMIVPLAAGAKRPITSGRYRFHSNPSGAADGRLLADINVPDKKSVKLTFVAEII